MLLTFPFTFIFLRQMHHSAQSLFHHNLDRILTHFGDIQRLGNGIRGSTVRNNCRAETPFTLRQLLLHSLQAARWYVNKTLLP